MENDPLNPHTGEEDPLAIRQAGRLIDKFEREFPYTTGAGTVIGKTIRRIIAFGYSILHALMIEDPKKEKTQKGKR